MKPTKGKSKLVKDGVSTMVSPANLSVLGEITFDAVTIFDSRKRVTYWNGSAERMFGWTVEEALGKTAQELFWSEGIPQEEEGKIMRGEYHPCRKDGSSFLAEFTCQVVFDTEGKVSGYATVHRHSTERKHMEEELALVAKLPAENPNPVMRFSPRGDVAYANEASKPLLDFWQRQTGNTIPDDLQKAVRDVSESRSTGVIEIKHEGRTLSCMLTPARDSAHVNFYGTDISARKETESELQDQMADMNTLLDLLPMGVWIGNEDCSVITGNPAAYRMMGFDPGINASITHPEPQTPSGLRILVEGKEVSPEKAPMQVVARTGKPLSNLEHEILFTDGTLKTVLVNIVPIFDEHGKVRKVIGAYADITERKSNVERLAKVQQVTAALSEAVTPFQIAKIMIEQGVPTINATTGSVLLLTEDGTALENIYTSARENDVRPYRHFPVSLEAPGSDAVRCDMPVWIKSQEEYKDRYPHLVEQIKAWGLEAAVAIPLTVNDRKLGAFTLSFEQVQEFNVDVQNFILTLAQQGAQALERAQLYQQVRQALSELRATYDESPIGMLQLDRDLRYIRVNETLAMMNGIAVADHIGKKISEIVPDLTPKLEEGLYRVMETGQPEYDIEIVGETQAEPGVPHTWLEVWYPFRDESGKVLGVNIAVQDITERRQAEEALRESGKRFAGVVNSAMDAIISVDSEQRVILFNPAAEKMFGYTLSQVIGQPLERFIPSRHRELHKEHIFRFGQTGETGRAMGHLNILSALHRDGTEFPIEASISHIKTGGQHLYTVILRDVTERKRAEDALLESQMELQILNDTLEQKVQVQTAEIRNLASKLTRAEQRERNRVARILHDDLQQRLYAIQIQVSSLSDRFGKENEQKDFARIKEQLQAAVLLTRHLSIDLSPPILHDEGLTQAVEWLASQMKKQHGLQVELQAQESFANPDEDLRVLVFNCIRELLFNIIKHAGNDRAQVRLQRVESNLHVEVRDDGKGFDMVQLPWRTLNIPEEDNPRPQSFGLSTIYHQLSLFGGKMDVQSEPGKGTVVTITIPYP